MSNGDPAMCAQESDAETKFRDATDEQLALSYESALADFALAEKYEHNAHLRPAIRRYLDLCKAEMDRRVSPASVPSGGASEPTVDDHKPLTDQERKHIMTRVANFERGHDTGLTQRAVFYIRGYEMTVAGLRSELAAARADTERLDWLGEGENIDNVLTDGTAQFQYWPDVFTKRITRATLREAIDAARSVSPREPDPEAESVQETTKNDQLENHRPTDATT